MADPFSPSPELAAIATVAQGVLGQTICNGSQPALFLQGADLYRIG